MKSLFSAAIGRLSFCVVALLTFTAANAQSGGSAPVSIVEAATVKFLGTQDDMLIFNVNYDNPKGSRFVIAVRDQNGNQLYQDIFTDKAFYRQFRLPKTDKDQVVFVIRKEQGAPIVKTFAVNINSHFVQEVAIKKL
jgi:hypothetical protein